MSRIRRTNSIKRRARLQVESLENRALPSTVVGVPDFDTGYKNPCVDTLDTNTTFVERLYAEILHRNAEPAGLAAWVGDLDSHTLTDYQVAFDIFNSVEGHRDEVTGLYRSYLNREPELGGLNAWSSQLDGGKHLSFVRDGILGSVEYYADHGNTNQGWLDGVYQDLFRRAVDSSGETAWMALLNGGVSRSQVADYITHSVEFNNTDIVQPFYAYYLNRQGEAAGVAVWNHALNNNILTEEQVAEGFTGSPEFYSTHALDCHTSTSVVSSLNLSVFDQSVTFTATVTGNPNGITPTGTVDFSDGSTVLGNGSLNGNGVATFSTSSLTGGSHTITATYNGDSEYPGSAGNLTQVVDLASSSTSVVSSLSPSLFGVAVDFTATVTSSSGTPTGTVSFSDGSTVLGNGTLDISGTASFATSGLSVGSHTITATYSGDTNFSGSSGTVTQTVNQVVVPLSTTTAVSSLVNPSVVGNNASFTATVTGSGSGTPTGIVDFTDGSTDLGSVPLTTVGGVTIATLNTSSLSVGSHTITATYSGDSNFAGSSGTVTQIVSGLTITPPTDTITATGGFTFSSSEGQNLDGVTVATFTTVGGSGFTASIDWGDGTTSTGTVSGPDQNGVFTVTGSHAYAEETQDVSGGAFNVTVTITDLNSTVATASDTATVSEGALSATAGQAINGQKGQALNSVTLATFTDAGPVETGNNVYQAVVNWGDGSATEVATISAPDQNGVMTVTGSHTYQAKGNFTISVTVFHEFAAPVTVTTTATITANDGNGGNGGGNGGGGGGGGNGGNGGGNGGGNNGGGGNGGGNEGNGNGNGGSEGGGSGGGGGQGNGGGNEGNGNGNGGGEGNGGNGGNGGQGNGDGHGGSDNGNGNGGSNNGDGQGNGGSDNHGSGDGNEGNGQGNGGGEGNGGNGGSDNGNGQGNGNNKP